MRRQFIRMLMLATVLQAPALADNVYLRNGRSFEGVIAEVTETQVKITLPIGQMRLARQDVLRVEESESSLQAYLQRRQQLRKDPNADPAQWLELALWARRNDFEYGFREAALTAAELQPELEGLAMAMRGLGYVLDPDLQRWTSYEESMRRRGFVFHEEEWITPEEQAHRIRLRELDLAAHSAAQAEAGQDSSDVALEALARLLVQRETASTSYPALATSYATPLFVGWSGPVRHGFLRHDPARRAIPSRAPRPPVRSAARGATLRALLHRQPGSIIPIEPHVNFR